MSSVETHELLTRAAALFGAVAADGVGLPIEVALESAHAVALLTRAGAAASPAALVEGDVDTTIREAIAVLARLDETAFKSEAVRSAAIAALRTMRWLS